MSEKIEERIKELEQRLADTVPNKHTQRSINYLRAQIAQCRDDLVRIASSKKGGGVGFGIKKTGDATCAFIGWPSVGKSSLLNLLTGGTTHSKVAAYDFTTIRAIPGMMDIEQAKIQLIDLPGIILGAAVGKGRGKEVLAAARSADLVLIILTFRDDGTIRYSDLNTIRKELSDAGIRLNDAPRRITITIRERGGIGWVPHGEQIMDRDEVKALANDLGIKHAAVYFHDPNITPEQMIDHYMGNRVYIREFVIINKSDLMKPPTPPEEINVKIGHERWVMVSALKEENIDMLRHKIFQELKLIRIFLKTPTGEADLEHPLILHEGDTLETLCRKIHKQFVDLFRYALIWGKSAKHAGQKFSTLDHVIEDGDIITIYLRR